MGARAIASVSIAFGLVSIPVRLFPATEASAAVRFKLMSRSGVPLRRQFVRDDAIVPWQDDRGPATPAAAPTLPARGRSGEASATLPAPPATAAAPALRSAPDSAEPASAGRGADTSRPRRAPPTAPDPRDIPEDTASRVVAGSDIVRGYEFEKGRYVLFTDEELDALRAAPRDTIDIVSFVPAAALDPLYYDRAYLLAPDRRGERTYALLLAALQRSRRTALARWSWKGKGHLVQLRPADGALVLHRLHAADEVRTPDSLGIDPVPPGDAELALALQLIEQASQDEVDPALLVDEDKQRILDAVERKIAGRGVVEPKPAEPLRSADVIDLLDALRASLRPGAGRIASGSPAPAKRKAAARAGPADPTPLRRPARR